MDHFTRPGDLSGQAWAQLTTGLAHGMKADWAEAITRAGQALALFRQTGDRAGQGWALSGLGIVRMRTWEQRPGARLRPGGPGSDPRHLRPHDFGLCLGGAGYRALAARRDTPGDQLYRQALAFVRERENPMARGTLVRLLAEFGDACRAGGDLSAAAEAWQQALQILRDLG